MGTSAKLPRAAAGRAPDRRLARQTRTASQALCTLIEYARIDRLFAIVHRSVWAVRERPDVSSRITL